MVGSVVEDFNLRQRVERVNRYQAVRSAASSLRSQGASLPAPTFRDMVLPRAMSRCGQGAYQGPVVEQPGVDVTGAIVAAVLLMLVVMPLTSLAVQSLYRRAVHRSMRRTSPSGRTEARAPWTTVPVPPPPLPPPGRSRDAATVTRPGVLRWQVVDRGNPPPLTPSGATLEATAGRLRLRAEVIACLGGAAFAVVTTTTLFLSDPSTAASPFRWTVVAVLFGWPVVPTVAYIGGWSLSRTVASLAVYLAVGGTIGVIGGGGAGVILLYGGMVLLTGVLLIAFSHRRLRAIAPFVAPSVLIAALAVLLLPFEAWRRVAAAVGLGGAVVVVLSITSVFAGTVGFGLLRNVARRYERRRTSDRGLLLAGWWMNVAAFIGLFLALEGPLWGFVPLLGVPAYLGVSALSRHLALPDAASRPENHRLLLLRTFRRRGRSERLLLDVGRHWRYLGTVQLIAGPDLASASMEPHELLDFVRGRLSRRFVADAQDLEARLRDRDDRRDPDGRFRFEEYFCHDDTWRMTVQRLAQQSAVVLLDVRGFTGDNRGITYELATMVDIYPLDQVVLAVDRTTDAATVTAVVTDAWRHMPATSPNRGRASTTLRVLRVDEPPEGPDVFLRTLCSVAATSLHAGPTTAGDEDGRPDAGAGALPEPTRST